VLHFLAEFLERVASATELQPVLDWMVERTTSMFGAEEGCLRLLETRGGAPDDGLPRTRVVSGRTVGSGSWRSR